MFRTRTGICCALVLVSALAGCNGGTKGIKDAQTLKIGYADEKLETRYIKVTDQAEVKQLLSHVDVTGQDKGMIYHLAELCTVEFVSADGSVVETKFIKPDQLERIGWGQLYLRDAKFYEKVCAVISKTEGRPMDPLKR